MHVEYTYAIFYLSGCFHLKKSLKDKSGYKKLMQSLFSSSQGVQVQHCTMLGIWILAHFLLGSVRGKEVCFQRLGCFTDAKPWGGTIERPEAKLPWSPEAINTRFLLYTKKNPDSFQERPITISAINPSTIGNSNFSPIKITRLIIHGFGDQGEGNWLMDMCKRMFQVEDVNCICIDWSGGSSTLYSQASNNIRVVGTEVAYFINILME
nr:inactive pancreatic lipase-related protein 1-like [Pelodiscus sinensis]|eukprot:XP_025039373.1 inactive pancreatic lipase-related protein 1-like [Pelodiscus sinensis]